MKCPFCNEPDFDASGLKYHFTYCEEYANVLPMSFCNHCGKCLDCLRIERSDSLIETIKEMHDDFLKPHTVQNWDDNPEHRNADGQSYGKFKE